MNLAYFKSSFERELNFCVKDNWINVGDVNDHRSSNRSELHAKIVALLSYTLQYDLGYYLEHNLRPWGGFSPDIIVFSKKNKKYYCEAIIEYESPNSYLDSKGSHVGKDLEHFFEFNKRLMKDNVGYLSRIRPADWLIITTLPNKPVNPRHWKYLKYLGGERERERFGKNPCSFMYGKYKRKYYGLCKRYSKHLSKEPMVLKLMNVEQVGNRLKVKAIDM